MTRLLSFASVLRDFVTGRRAKPRGSSCPECEGDLSPTPHITNINSVGDELLITPCQCQACARWYLKTWDEVAILFGPLDPATASSVVTSIAACPASGDKHCGCPAHGIVYQALLASRLRRGWSDTTRAT